MRIKMIGLALCLAVVMQGSAYAVTFSGYVNDPGNTALVGSGVAPSPALFGNDFDIANNVALYTLAVGAAGNYTFQSLGFAQGGLDPYFTLFTGTGASATFLASNYAQAFSTGGDFTIVLPLAVNSYTIAIGTFANMSFAENFGTGSLGDGFIGLGGPSFLGGRKPYYYELNVTTQTTPPVPELSSLPLLLAGLAGLGALRRRVQN